MMGDRNPQLGDLVVIGALVGMYLGRGPNMYKENSIRSIDYFIWFNRRGTIPSTPAGSPVTQVAAHLDDTSMAETYYEKCRVVARFADAIDDDGNKDAVG